MKLGQRYTIGELLKLSSFSLNNSFGKDQLTILGQKERITSENVNHIHRDNNDIKRQACTIATFNT